MRSIVVSLPSGAGVVRTEHGLVVTDDVDVGGGVGLRDDDLFGPGAAAVDEDHSVVGGRLLERSLRVLTVQAACFWGCPVALSHVALTSRGVR